MNTPPPSSEPAVRSRVVLPLLNYAAAAACGAVATLLAISFNREHTPAARPEPPPSSPSPASLPAPASGKAPDEAADRDQPIPQVAGRRSLEELENLVETYQLALHNLEIQHRLGQRLTSAFVKEAMDRKGGQSLFRNFNEIGDFMAYINHRAARLAENGLPPAPGEPGYDEYRQSFDELAADIALVTQDPLFTGTLGSGDPARISALQTACVSASLGLDEKQKEDLQSTLQAAYRLGAERQLEMKHKPEGDATAWTAGREQLNRATVALVEKTLTPLQRRQFKQLGYNELIYTFRLGYSSSNSGD